MDYLQVLSVQEPRPWFIVDIFSVRRPTEATQLHTVSGKLGVTWDCIQMCRAAIVAVPSHMHKAGTPSKHGQKNPRSFTQVEKGHQQNMVTEFWSQRPLCCVFLWETMPKKARS